MAMQSNYEILLKTGEIIRSTPTSNLPKAMLQGRPLTVNAYEISVYDLNANEWKILKQSDIVSQNPIKEHFGMV